MTPDRPLMRRIAAFIQRFPWTVAIARAVWRVAQPKFSSGVVGVVLNDTGQVLLVEHVFHAYVPWGLPGGWLNRNEDPAAALKREMREELELDVEVGPVLLVELDFGNHIDLAYLCYQTGSVGSLSSELLAFGWYETNDLPRLHKFHYRAILRALELNAMMVESKV